MLVAILLNGIQTYDPCYRGLEAYYPADPLCRLIRLPSPFSSSDSNTPVNLVDYQNKDVNRAGRETAVQSRKAILESWKNNLVRPTSPGEPAHYRPILVAVATSGALFGPGCGLRPCSTPSATRCPIFRSMFAMSQCIGRHGGSRPVCDLAGGLTRGRLASGTPPAMGSLAGRFSNDYLSPITRQLILRDLPFAIFPWRQSYDRGHALEDAIVAGGNLTELGCTFSQLLDAEHRGQIPSLVFSPMLVEDWCRLLISNLDLDDLTTIDGEDLLCESRGEIVNLIESETRKKLLPRDSLEFRKINAIAAVEFFLSLSPGSK